ncbi:IclR family transcriptional regulator C-terminal domain-containing protein [Pseudonocardia sp.]|uniref:IclR family transcriptional regulator n=1 Tax=Pseudonocardia sp. TaxID=60912 RepID=UPI002625077F|nr:IclR family transcriptional regulator C-terminal domain-containing protein [Pseudonocardia sp.]
MTGPAPEPDLPRSASPAVTRAAAVLAALAVEPTRPMGPSELSRRTGTAKATVINVCSALADAHLLRRSASGYLLGHRLAELGTSYLRSVQEVQEFYDCCRRVLGTVAQTVQLSVLNDGLDVVYLARQDGSDPLHLGLASEIGRSVPAHCTAAGKALLAALPPEELDRRIAAAGPLAAVTEESLREPAAVRAELDLVRERRYATEHGEIVPGVRCIGAAVHTPHRADGLIAVSFTFRDRAEPVDAPATLADLMRFTTAFGSRIGAEAISEGA